MIARRIGAVVAAAGLATAPLATDARVIRVGKSAPRSILSCLPIPPGRATRAAIAPRRVTP